MNMAARLMSKGMKLEKPSIVVDLPTYMLCKAKIAFQTLEPISIKGSTGLIDIFVPTDISDEAMQSIIEGTSKAAEAAGADLKELVGRKEELAHLVQALQGLKLQGSAGANLVIGDGGVGKHRLVQELMRMAELEFDVSVIDGECRKDQMQVPVCSRVNMLSTSSYLCLVRLDARLSL
jgi:hypothetical protein